jgi:transposase
VVAKGAARLRRELPGILEDAENGLPALARQVLAGLLEQFYDFDTRVTAYDRQIRALAAASEPALRLMQVEAIGAQTARPWLPAWATRTSSTAHAAMPPRSA